MNIRRTLRLVAPVALGAALAAAGHNPARAQQNPRARQPVAAARPYVARRLQDVIELEDTRREIRVSILPSIGNMAFEMKVKGHNVLRWPYSSIEDFRSRPGLNGLPFLGPWANRLDEQAFYANGKKYAFDMALGNVRGAIPIHGFLSQAGGWRVVEARADARAAWATSRLDFYKQPMWMKQFPFAHTIEMTYRLQDGALEVRTSLANLSAEPMPVAIGFHPYFQLTDSTRDEWTISVPARARWILAPNKVPTGETEPVERFMPNPQAVPLKDYDLDDVFGDLARDDQGRATVTVKGKQQRLDVVTGPNWRSLVIYSPKPGGANAGTGASADFICFEPMAGITNSMNMAQRGLYRELQYVQPEATWRESFWIKPSGF